VQYPIGSQFLSHYDVPSSVQQIKTAAFDGSLCLNDITLLNPSSIVVLDDAQQFNMNSLKAIYVPTNLYQSYLTDPIWSHLADKIRPLSSGKGVTVTGVVKSYNPRCGCISARNWPMRNVLISFAN
jgi:hexokinase